MIGFRCDYLEGCHPEVLKAIVDSNEVQAVGYGLDEFSLSAQEKIKEACNSPKSQVHFIIGGTPVNKTVLAWLLKPWEGVIAPSSGHIASHETGAIEATGHKVMTLPSVEGKVTAEQVGELCDSYFGGTHQEHEVAPGAIYVSQPTESGTLYTLAELEGLRAVCDKYDLPFFVDGARLAYALASPENDVSLADLARLCHVFYIGGTKCGTLCGEAVVIAPTMGGQFRNMMKQTSGILAKGRLMGVQFETLFTNGLYENIGKTAVEGGIAIGKAFEKKGIPLFMKSFTNQQFPILTEAQMAFFEKKFSFEVWEKREDGLTVVRFCTSWATKQEDINELLQEIEQCPMK